MSLVGVPNSFPTQIMDADEIIEQFTALEQTIRSQGQRIEFLTAQLQLPSRKEPKVASPEFFVGNRKRSRAFLLQLRNVFRAQPERFTTDSIKVTYAISFLRDIAFDWVAPFIEGNHHMLDDYLNFEANFVLAFGDTDRKHLAERELLLLRQGWRSASALVSDFQRLAMEVQWTDDSLFPLFYQSLSDEVKDEICKLDRPATIEEYYSLAVRIDNRLFERRNEKKLSYYPRPVVIKSEAVSSSHDDPDAMVIGSTRPQGPLSPKERQRRFQDQLCLYCGSSSHKVNLCPVRPQGIRNSSLAKSKSKSLIGSTFKNKTANFHSDIPILESSPNFSVPTSSSIVENLCPITNTPKNTISTTSEKNIPVRFCVPVQLLTTNSSHTDILAFVDSGADYSLVDKMLVKQLGLTEYPLETPLSFEVIDGSALPSGDSTSYVNCDIKINEKILQHKFYTIKSPRSSVVLGLDWLRKFKPNIDWELLQISFPRDNPILAQPTMLIGHSVQQGFALNQSVDNPAEVIEEVAHSLSEELCQIHCILPKEYHDYSMVFSKEEAEILPEHRKYDISIELQEDCKIPWGPIYTLSDPELETLRTYIDDSLAKGFIRPSTSPAGASLFFVKKKNGELRPVVDYRALNKVTVKNRYPLPLIHEMLNHFSKAKIFSKLDLRGAYNLVRIRKGDEWKTAFRCRFGHFEYRVMPFGLTNAPAVFQHLMNDILREYLDIFCVVYLDDILVYSETPEEHTIHVKLVLAKLMENSLYAKLEKCHFSTSKVDFLGYTISNNGIAMDERIQSIRTWPLPTNVKELQSFLGFVNFYRTFISNYTKLALPLFGLLKKDMKFEWSDKCNESFDRLKDAFSSASMLKHPDTSRPFVVETDASDFALGGVLSQYHNEILCPVAFYSCKLTSAEINYEIYDKELLAIIACFHQWQPLLLSSSTPITVYTDHRNLEYFSVAKHLNRRQARWYLFLCNFDFHIVYCPGKKGGKPDALSRRSDYILREQDEQVENQNQILLPQERFLIGASLDNSASSTLLDKIITMQKEDVEVRESHNKDGFEECDNCLFFRGRIVVPKENQLEVLKTCHDSLLSGHPGNRKTFELLSKNYWWKTCRQDCKSYVESCAVCAQAKSIRKKPAGLLCPLPTPEHPWSAISMDLITDLPAVNDNNSILVFVDRFTKMAHFIPCSKALTSAQLADLFVNNVLRLHGLPRDIVSDRGSIFVSQFWTSLMKNLNISQSLSSAYHPQSDGQTERVNQSLEQYLRIYSDYLQCNWVRNLPLAELAYNSQWHSSIKMSPFYANYGFDPPLDLSCELVPETPPTLKEFLDVLKENIDIIKQELNLANADSREFADRNRRHEEFNIGDKVYLSRQNFRTARPCSKLDWKQIGPFEVLEKINPVAYKLKLPSSMNRIHNVFHVSLLSKVVNSEFPKRTHERPPPIIVDDSGDYYKVEDILDKKRFHGKTKYLVSWKGYGPEENSWEPIENLRNCEKALEDFRDRHNSHFEHATREGTVRT